MSRVVDLMVQLVRQHEPEMLFRLFPKIGQICPHRTLGPSKISASQVNQVPVPMGLASRGPNEYLSNLAEHIGEIEQERELEGRVPDIRDLGNPRFGPLAEVFLPGEEKLP